MHAALIENLKHCRRCGIAKNIHTVVSLDLNTMTISVSSTMQRLSGVHMQKELRELVGVDLLLLFTQQMLLKPLFCLEEGGQVNCKKS